MPAFTTARTTAFIPALSPPEVSTASFILYFGGVVLMAGLDICVLDDADGSAADGLLGAAARPKLKNGSAQDGSSP